MITYISIGFLFILGEIFINLKSIIWNKIGKFLILFLFFFVAGLSYKIHNDYEVYEYIYHNINTTNLNSIYNCEKGFLYLNLILKNFFNFNFFKALIYLFNTILIWKGIRYFFDEKKSLLIITLLYLHGKFYFLYLPSFRQAISVSIFIYSLQFLENKKTFKYILLILIAFLFHKSSIILLVVYCFFRYIKINKIFLIIFCIFNFISFYFLDFIWLKILKNIINFVGIFYKEILLKTNYFSLRSGGSPREFLFYFFIFFIAVIYYSEKEEFYMKGYLLFQILYLFQSYIPIVYRFLLYFQIFFTFYIIVILKKLKEKEIRLFFKYFLLLFMLLNFNFREIKLNSKSGSYIPFHSSLELLYKKIPYTDTAEYIHVQNRGRDPKDFIRREVR